MAQMNEMHHERRRRRILEAARVEIYAGSYSDITVRQIAARAGIGKSTVYEYFSSKENLLFEVVREELEQILLVTRQLLSSSKTLTARCRDVLEYYHEVGSKIIFLIGAAVPDDTQRSRLADLLEDVIGELHILFHEMLDTAPSGTVGDAARELIVYYMLSQPAVWLMHFGRPKVVFDLNEKTIEQLLEETDAE